MFYYSPLHYCSNIGFIDGARALLDAGAFINLQSRLQETPLIMALQEKQSEMVDFLIQSRADVDKAGLHISKSPFFYHILFFLMLIERHCFLHVKKKRPSC